MYKKAFAQNSKLLAKNRSDKTLHDHDLEKSHGELKFHPMTNHNTKFLEIERKRKATVLGQQ